MKIKFGLVDNSHFLNKYLLDKEELQKTATLNGHHLGGIYFGRYTFLYRKPTLQAESHLSEIFLNLSIQIFLNSLLKLFFNKLCIPNTYLRSLKN